MNVAPPVHSLRMKNAGMQCKIRCDGSCCYRPKVLDSQARAASIDTEGGDRGMI